jgi:putative FmdB family regulatory protein
MAIFSFECQKCGEVVEKNVTMDLVVDVCKSCGGPAVKQFHATTNVHIPSYFHTSKSDIFSADEWKALKKDPDVQRVK